MSRREEIPLVDLRAALEPVRDQVFDEFGRVLDRMGLFLGENVRAFEEEFASYCEVEHGVGVSSGTDALRAALEALDVGPDDEVIVPSHTFWASIETILQLGAVPVLVDVEPDTLTIDPDQVEAHLSSRTRAIVVVHLYGHPANMDPILDLARRQSLRVIEDAAQAHGARHRTRRCGSMGDVGCFSFYFTKNLGALGEAGFVTTRDPEIAQRVRQIRDHGRTSKFEHHTLGHNLRLDELQAAVLRIKLPRLEEGNARRRAIAALYGDRLSETSVELCSLRPECDPVYHLYVLQAAERDALREHLLSRGIHTGVHYPIPGHLQPVVRARPHRCGPMPVTEAACARLVSLPIYPELTDDQVEYVSKSVIEFVETRAAGTGR